MHLICDQRCRRATERLIESSAAKESASNSLEHLSHAFDHKHELKLTKLFEFHHSSLFEASTAKWFPFKKCDSRLGSAYFLKQHENEMKIGRELRNPGNRHRLMFAECVMSESEIRYACEIVSAVAPNVPCERT